MLDDIGAPVCFGAITLYSVDSDRCLACSSFDRCGHQVQANIAEVSRVIDMEGLLARHKELKEKRKREAKAGVDSGKLKTQAPPVQRNTEVVPATIDESPAGPVVNLRELAGSILLPLLKGGTVGELRAALARGENPFEPAMREQWVLCELLRRGRTTRAVIESAVCRLTGDENKARATTQVLLAAKMVREEQGELVLET